MSDETTELLREGLTEHGIEWRSGLEGVTFVGDWCFVEYENGKLAATCEPVLTPEQAIAATMGGQRSTVEIAEFLEEFEHECYMLRVEASETRAKDDVVRESYERIRDEFAGRIAATVGNGTCEMVETESYSNANEVIHVLECSACGETCEHVNGSYPRCPHCGRKAVKR